MNVNVNKICAYCKYILDVIFLYSEVFFNCYFDRLVTQQRHFISSSLSLCFLPFGHVGLISNTQTDVTRWCHVTSWPRDLNAIFEGKIAQLWALVKSTIFIVGISNFDLCNSSVIFFILRGNNFRFIGTSTTFRGKRPYDKLTWHETAILYVETSTWLPVNIKKR